jgi:hypothetical protein
MLTRLSSREMPTSHLGKKLKFMVKAGWWWAALAECRESARSFKRFEHAVAPTFRTRQCWQVGATARLGMSMHYLISMEIAG